MWHVKERADCRLYSGPLSLEAQKILQALQAQRRHVTRQNSKHSYLLKNGRYGRKWESLSQSYTCQEQEMNSQCQWQNSVRIDCKTASQTLDLCQSSQASSCSSCSEEMPFTIKFPPESPKESFPFPKIPSHKDKTEGPIFSSCADADLTTEEAIDAMEVKEVAKMKEVDAPDCCSDDGFGDKQCKSIDIDSTDQDFNIGHKKQQMASVNNQSETLHSEDSDCPVPVGNTVPEDQHPDLINLKVSCKVQKDKVQERTTVTHMKSSSPHCFISSSMTQNECSNLRPNNKELRNRTKSKPGSLTSSLTSDPRVKDASRISKDAMHSIVKKAQQSKALVLTMVFRDGTTQLDPEQKQTPPACGLLLLIKADLDTVLETLGPNDTLVYLKLEYAPAWAQQPTHYLQEVFRRDLLLQVFSSSQLVVCYKAKDVLRVLLQLYKKQLTWKQVEGCQFQDPQLSGWLLDPTDPATCFQDLLSKHCRNPHTTPVLGSKKVSQIIAGLYSLYKLNRELCSKLQSQGLWKLYSDMELKMIPVLAAMEVCHIHVDKETLKRTSDVLGTKMKQLEQEAQKAAGQIFLLTSSTQLRAVLFEKLRLHERCENKKLPKTFSKQHSTSEAALSQLQDLHPLPKIILEYRQIHKIKSTFVDGILSCMTTKNYISSTWHQTSVVTGRISAKHPNFQALPRHPLQVTRKLYIARKHPQNVPPAGKEEEVVTVHPRAMFIPKEGWTFLSADFCQVELRLLAHLSSDPELLRIFTNPEADVFSMLASQWKGVSETEVSSEDREHAKRIVYSVVYGAGPERLSGILGVSTEQARRFQDSFLQTYVEVQNFIQKTVAECQKKGYVLTIMGRRRSLHNINSSDWSLRMQAERQAVNFVVQGSAADLCKMAMIRIFNLLSTSSSLSARLIAQLHDELLYEVEDSQVEQFADVVKSFMESLEHMDKLNIHLKVPLKVAVSSGKSWGSMSELNVPRSHPSFK
ncbi:DNA polymerase nu [Periophthalmus magnuspinnatus]|uniref:DNA polymerase nu n=1 Tax=Periophthalmus magnuspinnatus TaxID=409849 RepID=UPI002436FEE9|nr:DNA polymerase nu [Periophthalmus magnuspinnatus]